MDGEKKGYIACMCALCMSFGEQSFNTDWDGENGGRSGVFQSTVFILSFTTLQ